MTLIPLFLYKYIEKPWDNNNLIINIMKYFIEFGVRALGVQLIELTEEEKNVLLEEENLNDVYYDWVEKCDYNFELEGYYLTPTSDRYTLIIRDENVSEYFKYVDEIFDNKNLSNIDNGIKNNDTVYIIKMVLLMIGFGLVGLILSLIGQFFSAKAAVGFSTKLRRDLFKKLQELSFTQIDNLGTASMITRMTNDVNQLQTGINLTLRLFLRSPFVVFGAAIMASRIAPHISHIFFITIGVLSVIVFGIILISLPMYKKTQENLDNVLEKTSENLTGSRVIRAFANEETENDSLKRDYSYHFFQKNCRKT